MGFRIKTVSERTGIPRGTLLAWERRYGLPSPDRQDNGYREYSEADVERLSAVKRLVDAGHKVSEAISLLDGLSAAEAAAPPSVEALPARLLGELARFRRQEAEQLVEHGRALGLARVVGAVFVPLTALIDAEEAAGVLTGAQARFARSFGHDQLVALRMGLGSGPPGAPRALVAGAPCCAHDLELLAMAVMLAVHGWRVNWMGLSASVSDLLSLVDNAPPSLVCVGYVPGATHEESARWRAALRAGLPAEIPVLMGVSALLQQLSRGAPEAVELRPWSH